MLFLASCGIIFIRDVGYITISLLDNISLFIYKLTVSTITGYLIDISLYHFSHLLLLQSSYSLKINTNN